MAFDSLEYVTCDIFVIQGVSNSRVSQKRLGGIVEQVFSCLFLMFPERSLNEGSLLRLG